MFLPAAAGTEALLADEAARIVPGARIEAARGGVTLHGDERAAMALNLHSRLAQRVLWPVAEGPCADSHAVYALARQVDWRRWITPRMTLAVDVSAVRSPLDSLHFAALRVKDAVCDALREATGERPSVDARRPDLPLSLFAGPGHGVLYVDTSGAPLFKRGWREDTGEAPLKETLAAAMLAAAGWQGRAVDGPLLDPCCGAGTIAIEAAQLACGVAPGLRRAEAGRGFAFERLAPFAPHRAAWDRLRLEARAAVHAPAVAVHAGDVSFRMTDFAARNAARAGVAHAIAFKTADARERLPPEGAPGVLMLNPPYGERIGLKGRGSAREGFGAGTEGGEGGEGGEGTADAFFAGLAAHWKRRYAGWSAWVLSPDPALPKMLRLAERRRVPLWNGPIECRLLGFELVEGGHRRAGRGEVAPPGTEPTAPGADPVPALPTAAPASEPAPPRIQAGVSPPRAGRVRR
jgi:putative N6-adenine-specific DNA methylase